MGNYYARFGGGRMEKGLQRYLASRLPTLQRYPYMHTSNVYTDFVLQ